MSQFRAGRRGGRIAAATGAIVMSVAALAACSGSSSGSSSGSASAGPAGTWTTACDASVRPQNPCGIIDADGREWMLRGVNARVNGVFDVNFSDGRQPLEPIPTFSADDTAAMKQIGFNFLRLPIQWSAVEPQPGQYDQAYLDRISEVVKLCQDAGIQVLVDMHQDAYSKEIGEDGAPLWAITPAPTNVNAGGELNLTAARLSPQTQQAFASFWKNAQVSGKGLQEHYIDALTKVAGAVKDSPAVIGLDVFNEPWLLHAQSLLTAQGQDPGLNINMLYSFYGKAIPAVQQAAPGKLVMFEPDVAKNDPPAIPPGSTPQQPYSATVPNPIPWPTAGTVYAPHYYVKAFFSPGAADAGYPNLSPTDPDLTTNMTNSLSEASQFQAPLLLGEFGFTEKAPQYGATMAAVLALADKNVVNTAQWVWKENSQDAWGFYDFVDGKPVLRQEAAAATSQAYPQAISGRIKTVTYDPATKALTVDFVYRNTGKPHQIFLPLSFGYQNGYTVTCSGKEVTPQVEDKAGWLTVPCGDADGTSYTLQVNAK